MTDPDQARRRYIASMRRKRGTYYGVLVVMAIALATTVGIAWSRGEVNNTRLHTVAQAPPPLVLQSPSADLRQAWRSSDQAAIGTPNWEGTVVTFSSDTVRGRDARSGAQTWSYTRSNRTVCTAAQISGVTVAVFAVGGNCDEVTALDSGTGTRKWTRTLDLDGHPVNGRPVFALSQDTIMVTTPSVIYAIDPLGGLDRWEYHPTDCTINSAVLGTQGVLISQSCTRPDCSVLKFCANGPQLLLRDATAGRDDKNTANPDQVIWDVYGDTDVPVSADDLISAIDTATGALDVVNNKTGRTRNVITLKPVPSSFESVVSTPTSDTEFVWAGGFTYAIGTTTTTTTTTTAQSWSQRTPSPPTVVAPRQGVTLSSSNARVTVPSAHGIRVLDGATGHSEQDFTVPAPATASIVYPLGTGFMVSAPTGITAYR